MNSSLDDFLLHSTSKYFCYDCMPNQGLLSSSALSNKNITSLLADEIQLTNNALLSFIILFGTCFIAIALKTFRRSKFFGRTVS